MTRITPAVLERIPHIREGGETAALAIARLRKLPGMPDLGLSPQPWLHWAELETWFTDPGSSRAPAPDRMGSGHVGLFLEREFDRILHHARDVIDPAIVSAVIQYVTLLPKETRAWFSLGRVLDLDGRLPAARKAYRHALELRGGRADDLRRRFMWAGLARALDLCEGHDLEAQWVDAVGRFGEETNIWLGLGDALLPAEGARYRRILEAASRRANPPVGAVIELGEYIRKSTGDWRGAEKAWSAALERSPGLEKLSEHLVEHYLDRGRISETLEAVKASSPSRWVEVAVPFLTSARGQHRWPEIDPGLAGDLLPFRVTSRLEMGDVPGALELLEAVRWKGLGDSLKLRCALELRLLGVDSPKVRQVCEDELLDPEFDLDDWGNATGIWSHPGAASFMEVYLEALGKIAGERWRVPFMRALWSSRQGLDARALDLLESIAPVLPMEHESQCRMMHFEILSRPLWKHYRGIAVEPRVLERCRSWKLVPPLPDGSRDYWTALATGDFTGAATIAADLVEIHPGQMLWILSRLWYLSQMAGTAELEQARTRARVIARVNETGIWALREIEAVLPGRS